jgi:hypothetical protein
LFGRYFCPVSLSVRTHLSGFLVFNIAVIWIALAGYFKNNPIKAVSAYYYGMHLLTLTLDESGRRLRNGKVSHDTGLVTAMLKTKNPDKWVLTDKETGQKYRPNKELDGFDWEKI